MSVGEGGHERGEPHRAQGTFSVFEIKKKKKTHKKTQPRNTLKQLVCFIGIGEREAKTEDTIQGEKLAWGPQFLRHRGA